MIQCLEIRHVSIEILYDFSPVFFPFSLKIERPKTKVEDSIQARYAERVNALQEPNKSVTKVENVGCWDKKDTFVGGIFEEEPLTKGSCTGSITDLKGYWKGIEVSTTQVDVVVVSISCDGGGEVARSRERECPDLVLYLLWKRGKFRKHRL